jgi:hypothetical protein
MDHDQTARALKGMELSEIVGMLKRLESATREAESKTREAETKAAAAAAALLATEKAADKAAAVAAAAANMAINNAAAAAKTSADNTAMAAEMYSELVVKLMQFFHTRVRYEHISTKMFLLTQNQCDAITGELALSNSKLSYSLSCLHMVVLRFDHTAIPFWTIPL